MKKLLLPMAVAVLALAACTKTKIDDTALPEDNGKKYRETIDAFIKNSLQNTGQFYWASASPTMVWSAGEHSEQVYAVGYQPEGFRDIDAHIHELDINSAAWSSVRENILTIVLQLEQKTNPSLTREKLIQYQEDVLPVLNLNIRNLETVQYLRSLPTVRYTEPMGYVPEVFAQVMTGNSGGNSSTSSSSGCGSNVAEAGLVEGTDYTTISANAKQSWNYAYHNIPTAWSRTTGQNVKVFIIDTGCEFDQENLGSAFNQGNSSGRTVEKIVTLPRPTIFGIPYGSYETPDDGCGHGTSMAGAAAAPRGTDGNSVGIAYNCNLVTCRAAEDVLLDASREQKGVADAYKNAANRNDVKIISMSMGNITGVSQIQDAINYASNKGKLMFCAAGTSFGWAAGWYGVIFPAWLGNVNAVTGVRDNNYNTTCTTCHSGSENDFTVVMEKAANERHPLSLAMSGDAPSTVGGSSVATASMAGMAALVWAKFPTYTRDQVLNKLVVSSANYPSKNGSLGWGNVNMALATQ